MRVVRLGDRRQRKAGDRARPEDEAVSRAAELEVTEFLTLGDVVAGLDFRVDHAGRNLAHADRHEGRQADDGLSASMRMIARAATCARYDCEC
jgi:hypothetical protein